MYMFENKQHNNNNENESLIKFEKLKYFKS